MCSSDISLKLFFSHPMIRDTMKQLPTKFPLQNTPSASLIIPFIASLFFILTASSVLAADDDYLKELESEASDSTSTATKGSDDYLSTLSAEAEASAHVADKVKKSADVEEQLVLEKFLQDKKPTTFKYYKKLNDADKTKIVEYYNSDHADKATRVGHLRKKILDLYFKR